MINFKPHKGSIMLEFVLILPLLLLLIVFAVDMGRTVMVSTGLHDSVAISARTGARQGVVGNTRNVNGSVCQDNYLAQGYVYSSFCQSVTSIPGLDGNVDTFSILSPSSSVCKRSPGDVSNADLFVTVKAGAHIDYITPGLYEVIDLFMGDGSIIEAVAVAKCEVAYD